MLLCIVTEYFAIIVEQRKKNSKDYKAIFNGEIGIVIVTLNVIQTSNITLA